MDRFAALIVTPLHSNFNTSGRSQAFRKCQCKNNPWNLLYLLTEFADLVLSTPVSSSLQLMVTVQAPHPPWPQLTLVPVRCRWSRRKAASLVSTPTSSPSLTSLPFTRNWIWFVVFILTIFTSSLLYLLAWTAAGCCEAQITCVVVYCVLYWWLGLVVSHLSAYLGATDVHNNTDWMHCQCNFSWMQLCEIRSLTMNQSRSRF